ncbi:DUF3300 domain-containing protein [Paludibaculum fermentans]|uniref:DUF3300 domain-containing protein n=1 Tax=Paludibaculum fermentans TaxID=1473598 RepID=UPI003EB8A2EC
MKDPIGRVSKIKRSRLLMAGLVCAGLLGLSGPVQAQVQLSPQQLDDLVSRIALYPDPLLAQILTASTYSDQAAEAARWADEHSYLTGESLAKAIQEDNLPWDPSVQALLPFPSVLDMMAGNLFWTRQLGDAVLGQRGDVMDAVQAMRQKARDFGYLQNNAQYQVTDGGPGQIQIVPVDPGFYCLPVYDPLIVFGRPRVGLTVGISFGPRIALGAAFAPWGWGRSGFEWRSRTMLVDGHAWARTRENHEAYRHPYVRPPHAAGPRVERHELRPTRPQRRGGPVEHRR